MLIKIRYYFELHFNKTKHIFLNYEIPILNF